MRKSIRSVVVGGKGDRAETRDRAPVRGSLWLKPPAMCLSVSRSIWNASSSSSSRATRIATRANPQEHVAGKR
jgi:hypothetical protein